MSVIQIYYAWVLRQLNELFLPKEVIVFITSLCKPKFRFIEVGPQWRHPRMMERLVITQNMISGYFKSKPGLCHRQTPRETYSTNIHNNLTLKKFFLQNNILGIHDNVETYTMIMIITKCNRVVICRIEYTSCESDYEDESNSQDNFSIPEDSIKILNFPFETNKIFDYLNFIVLRSTSGIYYYFPHDRFGNDYFENHKSLVEIPIRNIKKMIFLSRIRIILTNDGHVWINNNDLLNDFKQVRITNVVKIHYWHIDINLYVIFLTSNGDIY
ncbi:MAG TPA: hypothetical protein VKR58_00225, partial [Aquella sp.]|nr:hypothetical protein [Aquella sp.]